MYTPELFTRLTAGELDALIIQLHNAINAHNRFLANVGWYLPQSLYARHDDVREELFGLAEAAAQAKADRLHTMADPEFWAYIKHSNRRHSLYAHNGL